jgi:hypothetical protein
MNNIKEIAEKADFNVIYESSHGSCFVKKDGSIVITSSWNQDKNGLEWEVLFKETGAKHKDVGIDDMPLLSVNEVYGFMCRSGAYMPYNRPTHEMLRNIAKSKKQ